jgi:hypothetical protein
MCLTQTVNAQYIPAQIHRDKANFVDNRGMLLSDQELIGLIGEDVFFDTVVGARKQYNAGRKLVISGATGLGVGAAAVIGGVIMIDAAEPREKPDGTVYFMDEDLAIAGTLTTVLGGIALSLGGLLLDAGLPLKIIGQSRLNWVENDYNERNRGYSLHVGTAPHGVGLTMTF